MPSHSPPPYCLQVYLTLSSSLAFSALGAYLHIALNVGGTLTTVGCLAAIAFLISLPASQHQERNRFALLMSAALLQGASFGPLLDLVLHLDPRILVTTFVGTAIAFGCFLGCCHHLQAHGVPEPGRLGLLCPLHSFLATQLSDWLVQFG